MRNYGIGLGRLNTKTDSYDGIPKGWVVRERIDSVTKKPVSLEYGMYVNPTTFVALPIHYILKPHFVKANLIGEYQYYVVPQEMKFGVSSFVNKKGIKSPILVAPSESVPMVFVTSICIASNTQIIDMKISEDALVLRKYIDSARKFAALILFSTTTDTINSSIVVTVREGALNTVGTVTKYIFSQEGSNTEEFPGEEEIKGTTFINLPNYIEKTPVQQPSPENPVSIEKQMNTQKQSYHKPKYDNPAKDRDDSDKPVQHYSKPKPHKTFDTDSQYTDKRPKRRYNPNKNNRHGNDEDRYN